MAGLFFEQALLPQGWARDVRIAIESRGRVVSVETATSREPATSAIRSAFSRHFESAQPRLPARYGRLYTEFRGDAADSFWTWRDQMYRFVGRMNADDIEANVPMLEMLEADSPVSGNFIILITIYQAHRSGNIGELAERIAASEQLTGISLTLLPVFYAHAGFGGRAPDQGQRQAINKDDGFSRLMDASRARWQGSRAIVGLAPHSRCGRLRRKNSTRSCRLPVRARSISTLLNRPGKVDDRLAWSGQRPMQWLFDHATVDDRWCLVHSTHATPDEINQPGVCRVVQGLGLITEANLGDGIFKGQDFLAQGGAFGIGSDPCPDLRGRRSAPA